MTKIDRFLAWAKENLQSSNIEIDDTDAFNQQVKTQIMEALNRRDGLVMLEDGLLMTLAMNDKHLTLYVDTPNGEVTAAIHAMAFDGDNREIHTQAVIVIEPVAEICHEDSDIPGRYLITFDEPVTPHVLSVKTLAVYKETLIAKRNDDLSVSFEMVDGTPFDAPETSFVNTDNYTMVKRGESTPHPILTVNINMQP